MECKIINIMLVSHRQPYRKVGIVYVCTLHVNEKLLAEMIFKLLNTFGDVFQLEAEF